jgi:hypothetical protein
MRSQQCPKEMQHLREEHRFDAPAQDFVPPTSGIVSRKEYRFSTLDLSGALPQGASILDSSESFH